MRGEIRKNHGGVDRAQRRTSVVQRSGGHWLPDRHGKSGHIIVDRFLGHDGAARIDQPGFSATWRFRWRVAIIAVSFSGFILGFVQCIELIGRKS